MQEREGEGGEPIRILKFRTMHPDAEQMLERHLDENPADRAEWDQFCKLKNDPRIIPGIGHLLRKTSLDELPQLWNILKGEMSLVGPAAVPRLSQQPVRSRIQDVENSGAAGTDRNVAGQRPQRRRSGCTGVPG